MAALSKFLTYVLPHVAGCSDPMAEQVIRSACIEFCSKTLIVQELTTSSLLAGAQDYDIDVPANSVLVKVLGVLVEDAWIKPSSIENVRSGLALRGATTNTTVATGTPHVYFQKTPTSDTISVYPVPAVTVTNGLAIRAAFAPSRSSSTVDDVLFEDWVEDIAAGAVSRLLLMPGQPFSMPAMAGAYRAQFDMGVRSASIQARSGQIAVSSRVQPSHFC